MINLELAQGLQNALRNKLRELEQIAHLCRCAGISVERAIVPATANEEMRHPERFIIGIKVDPTQLSTGVVVGWPADTDMVLAWKNPSKKAYVFTYALHDELFDHGALERGAKLIGVRYL